MKLREYFREESLFAWTAVGLCLAALAGMLDLFTGPALLLDFLYLIPIGLAAWYGGAGSGFSIAIASGGIWLVAALFGNAAPEEPSVVLAFNALTRLALFLSVPSILPALKREWVREQESSRVDYLTGLFSKRGFLESAEMEIERAGRYRHPFSAATLNVDHFRALNDRFGHNAADTLLRTVAQTLRRKSRSTDLIGRVGGDEFTLLLPETQSEAAQIVIRRLQKQLLDAAERNEWPVTFSIGAATYLQPPESAEAMRAKLESLVASVKEGGRNGFRHEVVGLQRSPM